MFLNIMQNQSIISYIFPHFGLKAQPSIDKGLDCFLALFVLAVKIQGNTGAMVYRQHHQK